MIATPALPDELIQKVEECAIDENTEPGQVLEAAVRKYLDDRSWTKFVERNKRRADTLGITEDDIPRLIAEVRSENKQRGRE